MSSILVRRRAESRDLTCLDVVKNAVSDTTTASDEILSRLVTMVSDLIEERTDRVFAREVITEKFGVREAFDIGQIGSQDPLRVMLSRHPVLIVEAVRFDGETQTLTDYVLEDPDAGFLYNPDGISHTERYYQYLEKVKANAPEPLWEVDYATGYVLPSFPPAKSTFVSVDVDMDENSITLSNHRFVIGDTVRLITTGTLPAGLTLYQDYLVLTATTTAITVTDRAGGSVVSLTDGGSGTHTITRRVTMPTSLEQVAIDLVVHFFRSASRDKTVRSERLLDYAVTYAGGDDGKGGGLPAELTARLRRWADID